MRKALQWCYLALRAFGGMDGAFVLAQSRSSRFHCGEVAELAGAIRRWSFP